MLRALTVASLLLVPVPGLAPMALATGSETPAKQKCDEGTKKKRKALGGLFGSVAGNMLGGSMGSVGSFLPTGELLSEALIAILDCKEQQQAAQATNEAVRGGVGTTSNWTSESRPNVSGSSSVTGQETLADGRQCLTVSDVVIVDGEETTAPKTMCRKPGESKYVRV
ncbi:hypothetical protein [Sphingosinicella sp. BN140058]|uniref:hypothetical protein n=1 Tax=Sphingosinicella sp. BN140058 TaxID=1892855 RepID=UPI001011911B|nr:hypothetical protein [Sphingosinicella sp. BN140058]QAY79087.1 hypothetical protein ETR14_23025 [Sphingosinicella sp. BN140058]